MKAQSPETVVFRVSKFLCIPLLLLAVSAANASLTVTPHNVILTTRPQPADTPATISPCLNKVAGPINAKLANLGGEFLQPPASSTGLSSAVKSLPAVPGALFMVLTGFLCVSLVKDRRVWLAALAGLLWLGQAGFEAVPQLALRLSHRNHIEQQFTAELTYPYYLENFSRLRSDIEGTQYIGLLHHLAGIPDTKSASTNRHPAALITFSQKPYGKTFSYPHKNTYSSPFAIIPEQYSLSSLFNCLALRVKQFICFSPAFIFAQLPRGPPISA